MTEGQQTIWHNVLDFFFPKTCIGCGEEGNGFLCDICGSSIDAGVRERPFAPPVRALYYATSFSNMLVANAIHALKYSLVRELAEPLGNFLIAPLALLKKIEQRKIILVPVPLHRRRYRERGFNQSELLARVAGERLGIPVLCSALTRTRYTRPQAELSGESRMHNLTGVFSARFRVHYASATYVLVDDVATTGATMLECARVLRLTGAKKIVGLAVAGE